MVSRAPAGVWLAALLAFGAAALPRGAPAQSERRPALVVVIVVDQMRADYLGRYAAQWTGGLRRFYADGTVFEHGLQDHASTEPAPAHATILSGREPAHT